MKKIVVKLVLRDGSLISVLLSVSVFLDSYELSETFEVDEAEGFGSRISEEES